MPTIIAHARGRSLLLGALAVLTTQCGSSASSPPPSSESDGAVAKSQIAPIVLFRPAPSSSVPTHPSGLAFDRSPYVPQSYEGSPAGTATYGVFTANPSGVSEWFATPSGAHAAAALEGVAIGSLGIEYSASLANEGSEDSLVAVSQPATSSASSSEHGTPSDAEQVYLVTFSSDSLRTPSVTTLGGPLPVPSGATSSPSVVGVSNGSVRLVIAGEGECCPAGVRCGGGDAAYESYVYSYSPDATESGPSFTGIKSWSYVLDASAEHPACAVGLAVDNAKSGENVPGEVTFFLYGDGSVQPWLTGTPLWGKRSSWKVAGAVSVAAYNGRVAIEDDKGNVYSADAYSDVAPTLVYAAGGSGECGGEAKAMAFDVTDPLPSDADPEAKGGSLILLMQDSASANAPVVCSIPATKL